MPYYKDTAISSVFKAGALAVGLLLSACATGGQGSVSQASPDARLFGDYLAGTYANHIYLADARANYFASAFAQLPSDINLGRRAVISAITNGDMPRAVEQAKKLDATDATEAMAEAVLGIHAFEQKRYDDAAKFFSLQTADISVSIMMKLMKGWVEYAKGDIEAARATFANFHDMNYFSGFGYLQTAELELRLGNYAAADAALTELSDKGADTLDLEMTMLRARMMSAQGKIPEALTFLETYSEENGQFETGIVPAAIATLKSGQAYVLDTTPQGLAARALAEPAYGFFAQNGALDFAEVFLRVALHLDPDFNKGKLWLGDILVAYERDVDALALYRGVDVASAHYVSSQLAKGFLFVRRDRNAEALSVFTAVNKKFPSFVTRDALGRAHLFEENYAAALPIYEALVESMTEEQLSTDPRVLYFRGICYEREGLWEKAVEDFKRVLSYKPDDADALNYLGYTWVDRGENLTKAFEMIRRAVELEPGSGAIVDSLGWAHYKLGQYDQALEKLEDAVELSPSSATIIDHLGDVYWKKGRKREATYQWKRALEYDPTEKEIAAIEQKLRGEFDAVQAAAVVAP